MQPKLLEGKQHESCLTDPGPRSKPWLYLYRCVNAYNPISLFNTKQIALSVL